MYKITDSSSSPPSPWVVHHQHYPAHHEIEAASLSQNWSLVIKLIKSGGHISTPISTKQYRCKTISDNQMFTKQLDFMLRHKQAVRGFYMSLKKNSCITSLEYQLFTQIAFAECPCRIKPSRRRYYRKCSVFVWWPYHQWSCCWNLSHWRYCRWQAAAADEDTIIASVVVMA